MIKILALAFAFTALGVVILFCADRLGFETDFPRGFLFLTILDLAVLKGYVWFLVFNEVSK